MDNSKIQSKFIFISTLGFCIFCAFLIFSSFSVHASDIPQVVTVLPYKPNSNDLALSDSELQILQDYISERGSTHNIFNEPCFIFKRAEGRWWDYSNYVDCEAIDIYFPSSTTALSNWSVQTSASNFEFYDSSKYITITFSGWTDTVSVLKRSGGFGWDYSAGNTSDLTLQFYGSHVLHEVNNAFEQFSYYDYYPVYTSDTFNTLDPFRYDVDFLAPSSSVPDFSITGHSIAPNNDPDNFFRGQNDDPVTAPQSPTPTNYTWNTWITPSIDPTSLESLIESLIDVVVYGFNFIKDGFIGEFNNLISNISNWVEYIVSSFKAGFNNVVSALHDFATFLFNNFVSLFEPIYNLLSGVGTLFNTLVDLGTGENGFSLTTLAGSLFIPDPSDFDDFISDSDTFDIIGIFGDVFSLVKSIFETLQGLNAIKIIHVPKTLKSSYQLKSIS